MSTWLVCQPPILFRLYTFSFVETVNVQTLLTLLGQIVSSETKRNGQFLIVINAVRQFVQFRVLLMAFTLNKASYEKKTYCPFFPLQFKMVSYRSGKPYALHVPTSRQSLVQKDFFSFCSLQFKMVSYRSGKPYAPPRTHLSASLVKKGLFPLPFLHFC